MSKILNKNFSTKKIKPNRFQKNKMSGQENKFSIFIKKYINPVKRYIILAFLLAVVVRIVITITSGAVAAMMQVGGYDWLISVAVAGLYGLVEYQHHHTTKLYDVIIHAVIFGIVFGLVVAVLDWVIIRNWWSFINIVKKPIIIALIVSAVSTIGFLFHKNSR